MISLVSFAVCGLTIIHASIFRRNILTPLYLYILTVSLTLGISYLKLDKAMTDFHLLTWFVLLTAAVAFLFGTQTARLAFRLPYVTNDSTYNWTYHHLFSWLLFFTFLFCSYPVYQYSGGFPLFSSKLQSITNGSQIDFGYRVYGYASGSLVFLMFITSSFRRACMITPIRWVSRIMAISTFSFTLLLNPTRSNLMCSAALFVISFHYLSRRIPAWLLPLLLIASIGGFVGIGFAKSQYAETAESLGLKKVLHLPYIYIANNYWNLDYALNPPTDKEIHPFTWGLDGLNGITEAIIIGPALTNAYHWDSPFNEKASKQKGLNTTGYLWEAYKDFRALGVIGIPFFIGFFSNWMYLRIRYHFTVRLHMIYCLFLYYISMWWFVDAYKIAMNWIWIFIIIFVTAISTRYATKPTKQLVS